MWQEVEILRQDIAQRQAERERLEKEWDMVQVRLLRASCVAYCLRDRPNQTCGVAWGVTATITGRADDRPSRAR